MTTNIATTGTCIAGTTDTSRAATTTTTTTTTTSSTGSTGCNSNTTFTNSIQLVLYTIIWPGLGLLGESYILFSIGTLQPIWEYIIIQTYNNDNNNNNNNSNNYNDSESDMIRTDDDDAVRLLSLLSQLPYLTCTSIIGGMIFFGVYTHQYGRRYGSITTATFMFTGCILMTFLAIPQILHHVTTNLQPSPIHVWYTFIVGMLLFAFGVGGEYPVAAASATERSMTLQQQQQQQQQNHHQQQQQQQSPHKSGRHIQFIFSMQGVGILLQVILLTTFIHWLQQYIQFLEIPYRQGMNYAYTGIMVQGYTLIWLCLYIIGTLILFIVFITRVLHLKESTIWQQQQLLPVEQQIESKSHQNHHNDIEHINVKDSSNSTNNNDDHHHHQLHTKNDNLISSSKVTPDNEKLPTQPLFFSDHDNVQYKHPSNIHWTVLVRILMLHSQYGIRLVGVSLSWFLWDVAFYGNKLFQSTFLFALTNTNTDTNASTDDNNNSNNNDNDYDSSKYGIESMRQLSIAATINASIALCGYYVAAGIIDHPSIGRQKLQLYGFIMTGLLFVSVGIWYDTLPTNVLIAMYFGTSFFGQCGPNATTFILPSEVFPTQLRTICHGVAAASGKLGALMATVAFHRISNQIDLFLLSGYTSFIAAAITYWFIPETVGHNLQENDRHWEHIIMSYFDRSNDGITDYMQNPHYLSVYELRRQRRKQNNFNDNAYEYQQYDDAFAIS